MIWRSSTEQAHETFLRVTFFGSTTPALTNTTQFYYDRFSQPAPLYRLVARP